MRKHHQEKAPGKPRPPTFSTHTSMLPTEADTAAGERRDSEIYIQHGMGWFLLQNRRLGDRRGLSWQSAAVQT